MRHYFLIVLAVFMVGAAPSRPETYTAGEVIDPEEVTSNEDTIYQYLQAGVDTIRDNAVTTSAIAANAVTTAKISDATIATADIATSAITTALILDGTVSSSDITNDTITTTDINDNTITTSDLNATLTFADSDFLNLASINGSSTTEGLKLPQATSCASSTAEGQICWDTDNDAISFGDGSADQRGRVVNAWVHFDAGGGTPSAIDSTNSFNVTSIDDDGTGVYTLNFTSAFVNGTSAVVGMSAQHEMNIGNSPTTTSVQIATRDSDGVLSDANDICVIAIGVQ